MKYSKPMMMIYGRSFNAFYRIFFRSGGKGYCRQMAKHQAVESVDGIYPDMTCTAANGPSPRTAA